MRKYIRGKYIRSEKLIESIENYQILKVKIKGRRTRYIAKGIVDVWKWSTPLYETVDKCKQAIAERLYYDNLPETDEPIPPTLDVSSDMFPIESDLAKGVYYY